MRPRREVRGARGCGACGRRRRRTLRLVARAPRRAAGAGASAGRRPRRSAPGGRRRADRSGRARRPGPPRTLASAVRTGGPIQTSARPVAEGAGPVEDEAHGEERDRGDPATAPSRRRGASAPCRCAAPAGSAPAACGPPGRWRSPLRRRAPRSSPRRGPRCAAPRFPPPGGGGPEGADGAQEGPIRKWRKSGAFARTRTRRGIMASSSIASTIELWWLAATISAPRAGTFSAPTTSIRA